MSGKVEKCKVARCAAPGSWTCRKCGAKTCAHHCGAKDTRNARPAPGGVGMAGGTATCGKCWLGGRS